VKELKLKYAKERTKKKKVKIQKNARKQSFKKVINISTKDQKIKNKKKRVYSTHMSIKNILFMIQETMCPLL